MAKSNAKDARNATEATATAMGTKPSDAVSFINAVRAVLRLGPLPGTYGNRRIERLARAWWPELSETQLSEIQRFKASEELETPP